MARAAHVKNPFTKEIDNLYTSRPGESLLEIAEHFYDYEGENFTLPTICLVGDTPVLREDWADFKPGEDDVVSFVAVVGDPITIIIAVVAVVAAVALVLSLSIPVPETGEIPEPDPVYTLRGQTNRIRLGDPIEDHYGRCRIYPSYAAISYNKFIDNEQYLYSLFCLGHGEFEIEDTFIEDTDIDNFDDVTYEYYQPGGTVTLFRDNVETSASVNGIDLLGSNEPSYPTDGWFGPFSASGPNTSADLLEVDFTLPQGLYYSNDDGGLSSRTVTAEFEYRQIDANGDPVGAGSWSNLATVSKTLRTNTPQRFTVSAVVAAGRYEVRGRRTNVKDTSHRAADKIQWYALRAYLPNVGNYGQVTMLAVRARASNQLNDTSKSRFNLWATRKLPIYNGASWSAPTATRSAVWALANLFRASYGGNISGDQFLDLDDFIVKDATLTAEGRTFDWTFDSRATVWKNAETIARAVRGKPLLQGSLITLVLERAKTLPSAVFGPANIIEGSFNWDIKLHNQNEYDGMEIEYLDDVAWKPQVVEAFLPDSSGDYLEPIKLQGVTDRDIAYREGMYEEGKRKYHRENISFTTGLEGHIPTWGDLILVQFDVPRWGQGGTVLAISGTDITVDTPVTLSGGTDRIFMKDKTGATSGPYTITSVSPDGKTLTASATVDSSVFDFSYSEKPVFAFGPTDLEGKLATVVDLRANGPEEVEITAVNYDSRVFDYDNATVAAPTVPSLPQDNGVDITAITGLSVGLSQSKALYLSWNGLTAAYRYIVEWSEDGVTYEGRAETLNPFYTLDVPFNPVYLRVAAVTDTGRGPWSLASYSVADEQVFVPVVPANINVVAGYGQVQIYWDDQGEGADKYELSITDEDPDGGSPEPVNVDATTLENSYLLTGLGDSELKYFQVRASKTLPSGTTLVSAWSAAVNGSTNLIIGTNFYGTTAPPDPGAGKDGAVWFDTDDDYRIYIWDDDLSVWVDAQHILNITELRGVIAANEIISNELNVKNGIITDAKISELSAGKIESGTITSQLIQIAGTGGAIQSSGFTSGAASGFKVEGNGDAEFNNVTVRGKIENSGIIVDGAVYLYRSDAVTKPALPLLLLSDSVTNVEGPQTFTGAKFYGWNATGSSTGTRLITSSATFLILSSGLTPTVDSFTYIPELSIEYRVKTSGTWGAWTSLITSKEIQTGSSNENSYGDMDGQSAFLSLTITATTEIEFRVDSTGSHLPGNDIARAGVSIQVSNWV